MLFLEMVVPVQLYIGEDIKCLVSSFCLAKNHCIKQCSISLQCLVKVCRTLFKFLMTCCSASYLFVISSFSQLCLQFTTIAFWTERIYSETQQIMIQRTTLSSSTSWQSVKLHWVADDHDNCCHKVKKNPTLKECLNINFRLETLWYFCTQFTLSKKGKLHKWAVWTEQNRS